MQLNRSEHTQALDHRLEDKTFEQLLSSLIQDRSVIGHEPEETCQLDPRDGSMVIYSGNRINRPDQHNNPSANNQSCPICEGKLTQVVDCSPLSKGFSFISQNLYPILLPNNRRPNKASIESLYEDSSHAGRSAFGLHLLQWSSSYHDLDWHNMPVEDIQQNLFRLSVLEELFLKGGKNYMPPSDKKLDLFGYFSLIKNFGPKAGASLQHGHQQVSYSNIMPQRTFNNLQFYKRHNKTLNQYLFEENPKELNIASCGNAKIIAPYFMRRPFNIFILMETQAQHLFQLRSDELNNLSSSIKLVIRGLQEKFEELGDDISFNLAVHSGPGSNIHIEFYPVMQASGGFERIGLWICQQQPRAAAEEMREIIKDIKKAQSF